MRNKDPELRYRDHIRHQEETLQNYAAAERESADDLLHWYRLRKEEIPEDEYRGAVFFKNREYLRKPGSLSLLYTMHRRLMKELPPPTREIAIDLLRYRFKVYTATLSTGGY